MSYYWIATTEDNRPEHEAVGSYGPLDEFEMECYEDERNQREGWNQMEGYDKYPMPLRRLKPTFEQYAEIGWAMGPSITGSTSNRLMSLMGVRNECPEPDCGIIVRNPQQLIDGAERALSFPVDEPTEYYLRSILRVAKQAREWGVEVRAM